MRSATSSLRVKTLFWRDLRENMIWFFLLTVIFTLTQPFLLYLMGVMEKLHKPEEADNALNMLGAYLNISQSAILAPVLVLAIFFLVYRLFAFVQDRKTANMYWSLPFSRHALFLSRFSVGLLLITLSFAVNYGASLPVFRNGGEAAMKVFSSWTCMWYNFYLSAVAYYLVTILCVLWTAHLFDAFWLSAAIQLVLPGTLWLGTLYAMGSSRALYTLTLYDLTQGMFARLSLLTSPGVQLFWPSAGERDTWIRLAVLVTALVLAILSFMRRDAAKTELRISGFRWFPLFMLLTGACAGLLGGFFFEALVGEMNVIKFFLGFFLFVLPAVFFCLLIGGVELKRMKRPFVSGALSLLACFLAFDLVCEAIPVRPTPALSAENVESIDVSSKLFNMYYTKKDIRFVLNDKEDEDIIRDICQYMSTVRREQENKASRRGFFTEQRDNSLNPESSNYRLRMPQPEDFINFRMKDGATEKRQIDIGFQRRLQGFFGKHPEYQVLFGGTGILLSDQAEDISISFTFYDGAFPEKIWQEAKKRNARNKDLSLQFAEMQEQGEQDPSVRYRVVMKVSGKVWEAMRLALIEDLQSVKGKFEEPAPEVREQLIRYGLCSADPDGHIVRFKVDARLEAQCDVKPLMEQIEHKWINADQSFISVSLPMAVRADLYLDPSGYKHFYKVLFDLLDGQSKEGGRS